MEARIWDTTILFVVTILTYALMPSASAQVGQELRPQHIINLAYGRTVTIQGNTAVVMGGATVRHPTFNSDVGTVDIYRFTGSSWDFSQNVISDDPIYWNRIGATVDLQGDLIAIGTPATAKGAALLFKYDGSEWVEDLRVASNAPQSRPDQFGNNLSLSENILVAGDNEHQNPFDPQGLEQFAFVFRKNGASWLLEDSLSASNATAGTAFGTSVSSETYLIAVGDPLVSYTANTSREGAVYVYEHDGTSWIEREQLTAGVHQVPDARFGTQVATDGNTIVVGAVRDSVDDAVHAGAAYVFRKIAGVWTQTQRLVPSVVTPYANFGQSISVEGNFMIIGAPTDTRFSNDGGSAYFYRFDGNNWIERSRLSLPDAVANDRFGTSVDLDEDWVIVGAPGRALGQWNPGAAYLYPTPSLVAIDTEVLPEQPQALSAFPNPFTDAATVTFNLQQTETVRLDVFDVLGQRVETMVDAIVSPGQHEYAFSPEGLADGLYVIRMRTESSATSTTVLLIR